MYHYYNVIQDQAGNSLPGYFIALTDAVGAPADLFADENGTPIESVSGQVNKAKTEDAGNVSFFVADDTYDINVYAPDAQTLIYRIRAVPMIGDLSNALAQAAQAVEDSEAAAALSGDKATEAGGYATAADQSAQDVAADRAAVASDKAAVAADKVAVEDLVDQARAATALSGFYPDAAKDYVPAEVTSLTVDAAGSGGTDGTFDLAWTGGNFDIDPTGTFTVSGGAVTAVTLTSGGLCIAETVTAPTPDFSASSGLTGATLTIDTGTKIASGNSYLVAKTGEDVLTQYYNVGGVATVSDPLMTVIKKIEFASDAEARAGTVTDKALSPKGGAEAITVAMAPYVNSAIPLTIIQWPDPSTAAERPLMATLVSYDLSPLKGKWLDAAGGEFVAGGPDVTQAVALAASYSYLPAATINGRPVAVTQVAYDFTPVAGTWLDNNEPYFAVPPSGGSGDVLTVKQVPGSLTIFGKGFNADSTKYIGWVFSNTPDAAKNSDVWRTSGVYEAAPVGGSMTLGQMIAQTGELELAIQEDGKDNFMGGNAHGNQEKSSFYVLADGGPIDLDDTGTFGCEKLEAFQTSTLYQVGTDTDWTPKGDAVATVYTQWRFTRASGGVALDLAHRIEWLAALTLDHAYLAMLPIQRVDGAVPITDQGARAPRWAIEDLSEAGFGSTNSTADRARIWSTTSGYAADVQMVEGWDKTGRRFRFSDESQYNKFYFDFIPNGYATTVGEVMTSRARYLLTTKN